MLADRALITSPPWAHVTGSLRWPLLLLPSAAENASQLATPAKKLEDTIRLAELVIEVLQQNEDHHAEVSELPPSPLFLGLIFLFLLHFKKQHIQC